jgi:hypothetical protein
MSGLALMLLAMPWSFVLFGAVDNILPLSTIAGVALYTICIFLNAATLYLIVLLFSLLMEWIERMAKPPQD